MFILVNLASLLNESLGAIAMCFLTMDPQSVLFLVIFINNRKPHISTLYFKPRFNNLPLSTACPKVHWPANSISWETLEVSFLTEDLQDRWGGSKVWELRRCCSSAGCIRGFLTDGSLSGVCLFVRVEDRKELPNLDNEGAPRNPILGDGTLPYRSMDCLKH